MSQHEIILYLKTQEHRWVSMKELRQKMPYCADVIDVEVRKLQGHFLLWKIINRQKYVRVVR